MAEWISTGLRPMDKSPTIDVGDRFGFLDNFPAEGNLGKCEIECVE